MSNASLHPDATSKPSEITAATREVITATLRACELAHEAASAAFKGLCAGDRSCFETVSRCETFLDEVDRQVDESVVFAVFNASVQEARYLLACTKFVVDLERIGDLIASFSHRAWAVGTRLHAEDLDLLAKMSSLLIRMVAKAEASFRERDVEQAIELIRMDGEMDRFRNLVFVRHIGEHATPAAEGIQVVLMAQALERAGDHAKNLGEEIIHFVSGRTVRHLRAQTNKSEEQLFIDWLKQKHQS